MIYSIASGSFGANFTCVGNPAPPSPTIPASLIAAKTSSLDIWSEGFVSYATSWNSPSFSITIELTFAPAGVILGSIALTVPETELKMFADTNPPASATFWPTNTWSPLLTIGFAGAPMC